MGTQLHEQAAAPGPVDVLLSRTGQGAAPLEPAAGLSLCERMAWVECFRGPGYSLLGQSAPRFYFDLLRLPRESPASARRAAQPSSARASASLGPLGYDYRLRAPEDRGEVMQ